MNIYSTSFCSPISTLSIASTKEGICGLNISGVNGLYEILRKRFASNTDSTSLIYVDSEVLFSGENFPIIECNLLKETMMWLKRYFDGRHPGLVQPLAPAGTPFEQAVWSVIRTIPFGETRSYRWLAEEIGRPKAARAVGGACARNPLPILVPCHRVVAANGMLGGYSGGNKDGVEIKKRLLHLEGAMI